MRAMRVLVSAASRHGSTTEIAARIAEILDPSPQIAVVVAAPAEVDSLEGFDAYVIGSAVYMGHWLTDARDLVHRVSGWTDNPVWLFSSGPIGDPPRPASRPSTYVTSSTPRVPASIAASPGLSGATASVSPNAPSSRLCTRRTATSANRTPSTRGRRMSPLR